MLKIDVIGEVDTQCFGNSPGSGLISNLIRVVKTVWMYQMQCTVWTLLHNQTNQTNSANLAICAAFLVVKIISSDHFLLLTIISSHSMSIKSKKLEFFPKFQKFALWISWFNFAYNSKTGAFLCKPSWIYFKYIKM